MWCFAEIGQYGEKKYIVRFYEKQLNTRELCPKFQPKSPINHFISTHLSVQVKPVILSLTISIKILAKLIKIRGNIAKM